MQTTGDLSLYFHIPFCLKKCPYCHFYSKRFNQTLKNKFLISLEKEIFLKRSLFVNRNIVSIYLGGGTPSLLNKKDLERIFIALDIDINNIEITIEANPIDISIDKLKELKQTYFNRISIGCVSFDDVLLKVLNRSHNSLQAKEAVFLANSFFENISIDLLYDIPHQDKNSFLKDLQTAKDLPITHLSLYNLTFEENTPFFKKKETFKQSLPSEKVSLSLLNLAIEELNKMKLNRYEISAFSKAGYESIHNTGYWKGREFLGFGPSAFSYFNKKRFRNVCNVETYYQNLSKNKEIIDYEEMLPYPDNIKELLAVNLRLVKGVNLKEFVNRYEEIDKSTKEALKQLKEDELIECDIDSIRLTEKGLLFYDTVAERII